VGGGNLKKNITYNLAAYVAAQATAEWLTGIVPIGIYRRDQGPVPREISFPRECSDLAPLKTSLIPLPRDRSATRTQERLLRAKAMNQAFVSIAGISCPDLDCYSRPKAECNTESYGFQLFTRDVTRTKKILRVLVEDEHHAITLALAIMETVKGLFSRPEVCDSITCLTDDVLCDGFIPGEGIDEHMEGLEMYRTTFPDTPLSWSANRGLMANNKWARIPPSAKVAA
jgi:hypothetical protein